MTSSILEHDFNLKHKLFRRIWGFVWLVGARWTPKQLWRWRRFLLRAFGAKMGLRADVRGSAIVWYPPNLVMDAGTVLAEGVNCYNMAKVHVKADTIVSQRAFICGGTHDFTKKSHRLNALEIEIGPLVWIAAEAFIGPGAYVSEGCVVGARTVVSGRLEPWGVYVGNPARRIKERILDLKA